MIFYQNTCSNEGGYCKLILREEKRFDDELRLLMRLYYEKDGKRHEIKSLNDYYEIPITIIKKLCEDNNQFLDMDAVFIDLFFKYVSNEDIKYQIVDDKVIANINDIKIIVIPDKEQMSKFKTAIINYYTRIIENNELTIKNKSLTNELDSDSTINENTDADIEINKYINECFRMEVPLFKCGTVLLVRDIYTYNQITNIFNFPEIGPCLGTMETLCTENKRYYVLGVFNDSLTTFVHELTHLAFHIYRDTSMKINSGTNNEPFAYLVDYFFQEWQHFFTNRCD